MSEGQPVFDIPWTLTSGKRALRPGRLASVVVEELAQQIIGGRLATGDVLPTEPVLCKEFGFSRTVIREGVKLLEERGLVVVEQGRGTTVQPRSAWNLLDPLVIRTALEHDDDMSLLDSLVAVRRLLEQEMAKAAAERLTEEDLEGLDRCIEQMQVTFSDYGRFREADQEFHAIVMGASGNEVGLTIVRTIHRHTGGTPPMVAKAGSSTELLERTVEDHRAIYDALVRRDGEQAAALIAGHIEGAWAERKRVART
ncbi:MAG TPA: FadR/GntR family transcriptional regulator [Gaiellaceae bacterium]|nr:FadR/GntR family transcriptional regulator [Gaiellaceae bacterium]